jgi:hypothetical protein
MAFSAFAENHYYNDNSKGHGQLWAGLPAPTMTSRSSVATQRPSPGVFRIWHTVSVAWDVEFPHSSKVGRCRYPQMRELRTQSAGRPLRTLYAFNPLRSAILLLGGDKTGDDRWYEKFVPITDRLFERHLLELSKEGSI